jgi:hypothetical protein
MRTDTDFVYDATHQRILEGVVLRLAQSAAPLRWVLRGGLLLRAWFRPLPRGVEDVDVVALAPEDLPAIADYSQAVLGTSCADGVQYDLERIRAEQIWLETGNPGVRVFATGQYERTEVDFHIDVTIGPVPRPPPVLTALPTLCGTPAVVWGCRPEAVAGHKMQALWHRGHSGWRPKDLYDLYLLLDRVPFDPTDLRLALIAYLADAGATPADGQALFAVDSWWHRKMSAGRWRDFARNQPTPQVPLRLSAVVQTLAQRLDAVWDA